MSSGKGQSILEKWLQDMPSSNQRSVKRERRDCDDLLASKTSSSSNLFLNQFMPSVTTALPSIPSTASSSLSSVVTAGSTGPVNNGMKAQDLSKLSKKQGSENVQDLSNCIDAKSIKGIFGWSTVDDIPLPIILREDQKLVPVRVVESKVIGKYSESLPWTVFSCINVRSYYITENEAKLLNEINGFHCDYHYGYEPFTAKDVVVCLSDVVTLSKFLEQSEQIFNQGLSKADVDGLGFVNISGYVIVPYISKKIVPDVTSKTSTTIGTTTSSPPPEATTTTPPPTPKSNNIVNHNLNNEQDSSDENAKNLSTDENSSTTPVTTESENCSMIRKYVPASMISNYILLVKVDKVDMTEWDASYLKMLYIYAGIENCQIPPNDKLCLLSDLKWDSSLCPLQIEECDPRIGKLSYHQPKDLSSSFSQLGTDSTPSPEAHSHHNHNHHHHPLAHSHTHPHPNSHVHQNHQHHHQTRSVSSMQNVSKQNNSISSSIANNNNSINNTSNHHVHSQSHSHNNNNIHHHPTSNNSNNCINHNQAWPLSSASNGSNSSFHSLHQIIKVDIAGIPFNAINIKPYSTLKAVLVNDIVTKMFPGVSELAAHYFLEKILQVKLYECNSLHRGAFARAYIQPLPGDKLVAVDVLRRCLPQLSKLILVSSKPHHLN